MTGIHGSEQFHCAINDLTFLTLKNLICELYPLPVKQVSIPHQCQPETGPILCKYSLVVYLYDAGLGLKALDMYKHGTRLNAKVHSTRWWTHDALSYVGHHCTQNIELIQK